MSVVAARKLSYFYFAMASVVDVEEHVIRTVMAWVAVFPKALGFAILAVSQEEQLRIHLIPPPR
jgi:hypothetical protein